MEKQQSIGLYKESLKLIRPYQWIKNLLLFSPLFFSGHLLDKSFFITLSGVLIFCLVSGIGYIVNDWVDRKNDQFHPQKKKRPFCAKTISGQNALVLGSFLVLLIVFISFFSHFPILFIIYTAIYICMTIGYSLLFKSVPIFEIFTVAAGFVIRILAGGAVSNVNVSSWLFLTVFFIAMMISIAKRLNELKELGKDAAIRHRKSQQAYSLNYLNSMLWACGSITLVVYSLYSVERGALVVYSILPATYGVFRFIYLTDLGKGSDPIKILFSDKQLLLTTLIFLLFLSLVIYSS